MTLNPLTKTCFWKRVPIESTVGGALRSASSLPVKLTQSFTHVIRLYSMAATWTDSQNGFENRRSVLLTLFLATDFATNISSLKATWQNSYSVCKCLAPTSDTKIWHSGWILDRFEAIYIEVSHQTMTLKIKAKWNVKIQQYSLTLKFQAKLQRV